MKLRGYNIFGTLVFIICLWLLYLSAFLDNPLGWGYKDIDMTKYFHLYLFYTIFFVIGSKVGGIKEIKFFEASIRGIRRNKVMLISSLALIFMLFKFINIRDIPLFGNPLSRYKYSLGGFPDYPARFLPVVSIYSFWIYRRVKEAPFLLLCILSILLPLFFTQRQDVIIAIIGIFAITYLRSKYSLYKIFLTMIGGSVVLLLLIGGLGVIRYGTYNLSGGTIDDPFQLLFWVTIGEISTSSSFGAYIIENTKEYFYGNYSLGEFYGVLNISDSAHGAELLRTLFTDQDTAQSIGIPFSFYLDFGIYGVIIFSFLSGLIYKVIYLKMKNNGKLVYSIIYVLYTLQLFWSLRSGSLPFNPIFLYQAIMLYFIFGKYHSKFYKNVITPIVIMSFGLSILFALIRF